MRKGKTKLKKFFRACFGKDLDLKVQFLNLTALLGIASGVVAVIISIVVKEYAAIIVDLLTLLFSSLILYISLIRKRYNLCCWVMVITIFIIAFPALFILCGGHAGGTSYFFMVALVFTSNILEKRARIFALALEFTIYVACYVAAGPLVKKAADFETEHMYALEGAINFVFAGILLIIAVMFRAYLHDNRQAQIQELNRELKARNETLTRYDRMKGVFLGTVAHEINTPLAIIAASSRDTLDLLSMYQPDMDEIIENQKIIGERVKLIDTLLLDLMDAAAIEDGRLSLERKPVILSEFLKKTCDSQFGRLDVNNNRLTYDIMQELPEIWADSSRLEQVMLNLLSNAIRYTKDGIITVKLRRKDNMQIVSVIDNGEGMDEEVAKIVFKQYYSTKADYWRHGIGLSVCRQIIAAHEGEIWIESEKGRGTDVSFSLKEDKAYE